MLETTVTKTITKIWQIIWLNFNKERNTIEAHYKVTEDDGTRIRHDYYPVPMVNQQEYAMYASLNCKRDLAELDMTIEEFLEALIRLRIKNVDPDLPLSQNDLALWAVIEQKLAEKKSETIEFTDAMGQTVEEVEKTEGDGEGKE